METLRNVLSSNDLFNVQTYIQSGNVVFSAKEASVDRLRQKLMQVLKDNFAYELPFVLMPFDTFCSLTKNIPSSFNELNANAKIFISFLVEIPDLENIDKLQELSNENENYEVREGAVYVWCIKDGRKLNFSNNLVEKILKVGATTRNLNTVERLSTF
ncbi:DUF1697 domain-containing protein [Flavobacteriaceae bacterium M23B6Z8]